MQYDVFIQDNFVLTIDAPNTGEALKIVGLKIKNNEINFDPNKPHNIRVEPKNE